MTLTACITVLTAALSISALAPAALAQTTTAGKVVGTVTDQTGAVAPKANLQLQNAETGAVLDTKSDDAGGFVFPVVNAGNYRITVKLAGFRIAVVAQIAVDVEKTTTVPVSLEVGGDTEVVEVRATATAHLQTTDAQIGNVLSTDSIMRLPALQRNAIELMNLQPGVVAGGAGLAMRVSGAVDDQNTVTLDGIDITQNLVATGTSIPTPDDSVEEFRANVANPGATLMRASGGQITLIGRRGSNNFHGALYEYLQNNDLNANTWDNNRAGLAKAIIHDNRFGGRLGGAIKKNKTFFFANYEARRFDSVSQVTRTVPTALLRQGIVQFQGPSGVEQFNLKTAAICNAPTGSVGTTACDPRGLGMSPSVAAQFADLPLPNLSGGDGLNTGSYFANLPTPTETDYGVMRIDHMVTDKLTLNATFTYFRSDSVASGDISILNGKPSSAENNPAARHRAEPPVHMADLAHVGERGAHWLGSRHQPNQRDVADQGRWNPEHSRIADRGRPDRSDHRQRRKRLHGFADRHGHAARPVPGRVATERAASRRYDQDVGQAPDPVRRPVEQDRFHPRPRR